MAEQLNLFELLPRALIDGIIVGKGYLSSKNVPFINTETLYSTLDMIRINPYFLRIIGNTVKIPYFSLSRSDKVANVIKNKLRSFIENLPLLGMKKLTFIQEFPNDTPDKKRAAGQRSVIYDIMREYGYQGGTDKRGFSKWTDVSRVQGGIDSVYYGDDQIKEAESAGYYVYDMGSGSLGYDFYKYKADNNIYKLNLRKVS